jgi:hypothetical protein
MQWLMLQQALPEDFVIATGVQYSVRDFVNAAADELGIKVRREGGGVDEKGYDDKGIGVAPTVSYNPVYAFLTDGTAPHIKVVSGFNADPFDSTPTTVTFRNSGIKTLTITYGTGPDIRFGGLTTQSIFLTGLSWSSIVPVQLIYFRGKSEADRVRLNWATATEINSSHFNVERSTDLKDFTTIGKITSAGDSRQRIEYNFLDEAPLPGVNYYRLKQVDKDGTSELSKIIYLI